MKMEDLRGWLETVSQTQMPGGGGGLVGDVAKAPCMRLPAWMNTAWPLDVLKLVDDIQLV